MSPIRSDGAEAPILVFDSGIGGLSVAREIARLMPSRPLLYAADLEGLPYGLKEEATVVARTVATVAAAASLAAPSLIVVACNTASTVALPALRAAFAVPVVGTVPAIKPAAALTASGGIGLLGTEATVRRHYTDALIAAHAPDKQIVRLGSARLVEIAETTLGGAAPDIAELAALLAPLFDPALPVAVDTVVLACTHFPLLLPWLERAVPRPVRWVDSGAAIARRVETLLGAAPPGTPGSRRAAATGSETLRARLAHGLRGDGYAAPVALELALTPPQARAAALA